MNISSHFSGMQAWECNARSCGKYMLTFITNNRAVFWSDYPMPHAHQQHVWLFLDKVTSIWHCHCFYFSCSKSATETTYVLLCVSLLSKHSDHLFMSLFATCRSSLVTCPMSFDHFLIEFFTVEFQSTLYF